MAPASSDKNALLTGPMKRPSGKTSKARVASDSLSATRLKGVSVRLPNEKPDAVDT
jgi:hypothetical protein